MDGTLGAHLDTVTPPRVERRAQPRVTRSLPLRLTVGGHTVAATMVDITEHGLRCSVDGAIVAAGRPGSVVFALDTFLVTARVRVLSSVLVRGGSTLGLRFEHVPAPAATAIRRFLDRAQPAY